MHKAGYGTCTLVMFFFIKIYNVVGVEPAVVFIGVYLVLAVQVVALCSLHTTVTVRLNQTSNSSFHLLTLAVTLPLQVSLLRTKPTK